MIIYFFQKALQSISSNIVIDILLLIVFIGIMWFLMCIFETARQFVFGFPIVWTVLGYRGVNGVHADSDLMIIDIFLIVILSFISIRMEKRSCLENLYEFVLSRFIYKGLIFGLLGYVIISQIFHMS